jgi:hypothetical protein
MAENDSIARLARQIDTTERAERLRRDGSQLASLRVQGAGELHQICADFAASVNDRLSQARLELSPPAYEPAAYREKGVNLIQISSQGRQMQITFEAPPQPVSIEKFLIPYILEGEVRTYNQEMLKRFEVRSRMIFFCVEADGARWRFFDWRTRGTGVVDRVLLASLMEPLF